MFRNHRFQLSGGAALVLVFAMTASAQLPEGVTPLDVQARDFINRIRAGDHDELPPLMDATMNAAMTPKQFEELWQTLGGQVGEFKTIDGTRRADAQDYRIVLVTCSFARAKLEFRVVYDGEGLVAGFFVAPTGQAQVTSKLPAYAARDTFNEEEVEVVTGDYRLPGLLAIPNSAGKAPIVILVHGSGPNDRDETIGPNKVFRDLAWGLASNGVASLRYDKRTKVYGSELDLQSLTHREEVVEDALSAVELVSGDDRFDSQRIVLLGHSLGGQLAPLIAAEAPAVDGAVIMAGSTRPLLELMAEQYEYIFMEDGSVNEVEKKQLDELKQSSQDLLAGRPVTGVLAAVSKSYIEQLDAYDPLATVRTLGIPILVVQGARDYQVLPGKNFENWKKALADHQRATFHLYPTLDHLFMSGQGSSYPRDYADPRNVSEDLIRDLVSWIAELQELDARD